MSGNGRIVGGYKWKRLRYNLEEEFSKKFFFFSLRNSLCPSDKILYGTPYNKPISDATLFEAACFVLVFLDSWFRLNAINYVLIQVGAPEIFRNQYLNFPSMLNFQPHQWRRESWPPMWPHCPHRSREERNWFDWEPNDKMLGMGQKETKAHWCSGGSRHNCVVDMRA